MKEELRQVNNKKEYVLFFVVVNFGMGSKILKEAKELGVTGGTIFLGKGTVKSHILELLGLDEIKKEIVLMIAEDGLEEKVHEGLTKKFHLDKPNHGIVFSLPVKKVLGLTSCKCGIEERREVKNNMQQEVIFTVVERGLAEEVVEAAVSAGAEGGTIINARGAGVHENSMLFAMSLEPEKEIVMILIDKAKASYVIEAINNKLHVDEPGKGVLFTMDVNKTSGLFNDKKD